MSEPRTVRLVLDTSAVVAWTRGSVAVGEILAEIDAEHGAVIVPLPCLVEAAHATAMLEQEMLELLVGHAAAFLVSDDPGDWRALTAIRTIVGRPDLASAALLALDGGTDVFTREGSWYAGVDDGRIVLAFDE